jgi:hypothetical protein
MKHFMRNELRRPLSLALLPAGLCFSVKIGSHHCKGGVRNFASRSRKNINTTAVFQLLKEKTHCKVAISLRKSHLA